MGTCGSGVGIYRYLCRAVLALVWLLTVLLATLVSGPASRPPALAQAWAQTPVQSEHRTTVRAWSCPPSSAKGAAHRQLRGVWIATVANLDWPSRPGLPATVQQKEARLLLDQVRSLGFNAVFVQVRPLGDAFYPSRYAPWSAYLSGVQGRSPGYDPLAFLLREAHRRNLEFHAWLNPFRVSFHDSLAALAPTNPARQHPEWVMRYARALYLNPGLPAVRRLLVATVEELLRRYDVDGIHLDDYFYPYPIDKLPLPDWQTYRQYGAGRYHSIADWRRANVNELIAALAQTIHRLRPSAKFGVSPFGVWRNRGSDPSGSATETAVTSYDSLYADTRTWIRHQWLDYIVPQLYWPIGFHRADYATLVRWWVHEVEGWRVHLYIGQAAYKLGSGGAWNDAEELRRHLRFDLGFSSIKGELFFRLGSLVADPLGFARWLRTAFYHYPALIPVMPWLGGGPPPAPRALQAQLQPQQAGRWTVRLHWQDSPGAQVTATYYAIYRLTGSALSEPCALADPRSLLATQHRLEMAETGWQVFVDRLVSPGPVYTYYVTALDRLHHESKRAGLVVHLPAVSSRAVSRQGRPAVLAPVAGRRDRPGCMLCPAFGRTFIAADLYSAAWPPSAPQAASLPAPASRRSLQRGGREGG
ncbi:MAG: family 10 glycosylhydrolase [Thermogemmatispora sp.]|uniref:glycoside hydrolase family 10 protein n=1 Tax=Thermogemmatispora sp. TaxID=1968838 RepID=UPI001E14CF36|nr:family 10 glycosylhydrolase [Thermogemmatispora sp.]MBX5451129.1 family 10 glycosylhydrolase [Thermogemmatispora sp.]